MSAVAHAFPHTAAQAADVLRLQILRLDIGGFSAHEIARTLDLDVGKVLDVLIKEYSTCPTQ